MISNMLNRCVNKYIIAIFLQLMAVCEMPWIGDQKVGMARVNVIPALLREEKGEEGSQR